MEEPAVVEPVQTAMETMQVSVRLAVPQGETTHSLEDAASRRDGAARQPSSTCRERVVADVVLRPSSQAAEPES